jgi:hypothetical protein
MPILTETQELVLLREQNLKLHKLVDDFEKANIDRQGEIERLREAVKECEGKLKDERDKSLKTRRNLDRVTIEKKELVTLLNRYRSIADYLCNEKYGTNDEDT